MNKPVSTTKFPVQGFLGGPTPNKVTKPQLITARRNDVVGATVYDLQGQGAYMVSEMTAAGSVAARGPEQPDNRGVFELSPFMTSRLALAGVGTAWYHLKRKFHKYERPVQGRTIRLPKHYLEEGGGLISADRALDAAHEAWAPLGLLASTVLKEYRGEGITFDTNKKFGRAVANAALELWGVNHARSTSRTDGSANIIQENLKIHTNEAYGACNMLGYELGGELPTLMALADRDSALAVSLRTSRQAGTEEIEALNNLWESTQALRLATRPSAA